MDGAEPLGQCLLRQNQLMKNCLWDIGGVANACQRGLELSLRKKKRKERSWHERGPIPKWLDSCDLPWTKRAKKIKIRLTPWVRIFKNHPEFELNGSF
jgi:hypothetical protein